MFSFLIFWLTAFILGLAVLPATGKLFSSFYDRGYFFSKTLGILLISYLLWIMATFGILDNSRGSIFLILIAASAASWVFTYKDTLRFLKQRLNYVFLVEVVFFLVLAIFSLLRAANPELLGGEKPMDLAFMNSILRSQSFPPPDPWFAGFTIGYYYFGHLMMATLAKLSGLKMAVAFNLEIGLVFALAAIGIFGLVFELVLASEKATKRRVPHRPLIFGLLATLIMIAGSNFEVFGEILASWGFGSAQFWQFMDIPNLAVNPNVSSWLPNMVGWWWRASRVIPGAITEFPFFSALFGDLHAHVLALPLTTLAVGLALNQLRNKVSFPYLILVALCLGSLGFANTWDLPVYLTLWAATLVLSQFLSVEQIRPNLLKKILFPLAIVTALSFLLYAPYYLFGYRSNIGIEFILTGPRVKLHHFFLQFGLFLIPLLAFLIWDNLLRPRNDVRRIFFFSLISFITLVPLILSHLWLFALLAFLAESAIFSLYWLINHPTENDTTRESTAFALLLIFVTALLAFLSETVYAAGYRGNTIFKFYFAIWLLASIATGFVVYRLWVSITKTKARFLFRTIGFMLLLASLTYPVLATRQKLAEPEITKNLTLDGLAFLAEDNPQEYEAILWLNQTARNSSVILELPGQSWSAGSRVSAYTGLPTPVGWIQSEEVLRGKFTKTRLEFPELYARLRDIELIYGSGDEATTRALLGKYRIRYVYIGGLERNKYPGANQKFSRFLKPVFQNETVVIFENRD